MISTEDEARAYVAGLTDPAGMKRLETFEAMLRAESELQNLVSRSSLHDVWVRHFADSAQLLALASGAIGHWLDLGAGAGFPGLVIAALQPARPVSLIESRRKRIDWLREVVDRLALTRCTIIGLKIEATDGFEADVISARAFAPLRRLVELSARFSTSETQWVLPKGRSAAQELDQLPQTLRKMFHVEQSVTDPEAGILVAKGKMEVRQ